MQLNRTTISSTILNAYKLVEQNLLTTLYYIIIWKAFHYIQNRVLEKLFLLPNLKQYCANLPCLSIF